MHIVKAVSLKVASTLMFALMGAQVRYLGGAYPMGEVAFCRALFALIPIVVVFGWRRELRGALRTSRPMDHVLRGMFSIVGTFCTFGALARLPLAEYTAIVAGAGIFVILRERQLGLGRLRDMPIAPIAVMADDEADPDAPVPELVKAF
jgi:drug/metabolite transporter (DMT)-like permease